MKSLTGLLLLLLLSAAAQAQSLDDQINLIRQINNTDRFRRILPHVKVTRIMQIENKVDNAVASRISAEIPLLR